MAENKLPIEEVGLNFDVSDKWHQNLQTQIVWLVPDDLEAAALSKRAAELCYDLQIALGHRMTDKELAIKLAADLHRSQRRRRSEVIKTKIKNL